MPGTVIIRHYPKSDKKVTGMYTWVLTRVPLVKSANIKMPV